MNRKEYLEMQKTYKRGNIILLVQVIIVLIGLAYFLL
jgi:hypothetical protein